MDNNYFPSSDNEDNVRPPDPIKRQCLLPYDYGDNDNSDEEDNIEREYRNHNIPPTVFRPYFEKDDEEPIIQQIIKQSISEYNKQNGIIVYDDDTVNEIIEKSKQTAEEEKQIYIENESKYRTELCKPILKLLERTKNYIDEDRITYEILNDFCKFENGTEDIYIYQNAYNAFTQTLTQFIAKKKMDKNTLDYIVNKMIVLS